MNLKRKVKMCWVGRKPKPKKESKYLSHIKPTKNLDVALGQMTDAQLIQIYKTNEFLKPEIELEAQRRKLGLSNIEHDYTYYNW